MASATYKEAVAAYERSLVFKALARHDGHCGKAAAELGVHRNTFTRTLQRLEMNPVQIKQSLQRKPVASVRPFVARAERIA